jgi:Tol biopolymer transport system component
MGLAWSPDGSKIAFDYHRIDVVNSDIYVIYVQCSKGYEVIKELGANLI